MKVHAARDALTRAARRRCVAVAAVLGAGLAIGSLSGLTSAAYAVPMSRGGHGGGSFVASDSNGNGSRINMGNGRNFGNYMVVGSLKNANGLQQATIGVNGSANSQANVCRRWGGRCWFNQHARVSRSGRR
ncbi:hypothetical protein [Microbispora sp. H10949]|uniref:hypothetical protein n=1 Tax=Microbispora sp. H10949 TaxID=2729111 RepID=UPI001602CECE|nr:hypothetical protein [Microbispora sp. H10949]